MESEYMSLFKRIADAESARKLFREKANYRKQRRQRENNHQHILDFDHSPDEKDLEEISEKLISDRAPAIQKPVHVPILDLWSSPSPSACSPSSGIVSDDLDRAGRRRTPPKNRPVHSRATQTSDLLNQRIPENESSTERKMNGIARIGRVCSKMKQYGSAIQNASRKGYPSFQLSRLADSLDSRKTVHSSERYLREPRLFQMYNNRTEFRPKKILILTKMTRLEFERHTNPGLTEKELEETLRQRGSSYNHLLENHDVHKRYLKFICSEFEKRKVEYRVVQRWEYTEELIDEADAIFTAGGDGTFLLGASKIRDRSKPVIGINSNPASSVGHLCLMKNLPDTHFPVVLDRLLSGDFKWLWRQRIRVTMNGGNEFDPIQIHDQQLGNPGYRWSEKVRVHENSHPSSSTPFRVPTLALNEVFVGESLPSGVSYFDIRIDDHEKVKQKSSGLIVCTGTGSTSWAYNANKLTENSVSDILKMRKEVGTEVDISRDDSALIQRIAKEFNEKLIFDPSDTRMTYVVRDPLFKTTHGLLPSRGFATKRVEIKSRCFDGQLVIDGGTLYSFDAGTKAVLEICPEDALKTVIFRE